MSKLKSLTSFISLCITNTGDVLKNLYNFTEETRTKNIVVKKHKLPNGLPTLDLLELFPDFNESLTNYSFLEGTSFITDLALLKMISRKYKDANYIEFGTWRGESISNVADVTPNCISLSFSEQEMKAHHIHPNAVKVSRMFSKNNPRIKHIEHNTQTYNFKDLEKKFDVIFVDADHKYEGVKIDTQNAFKLLKDENSVIIWHDCGRGMENDNYQVLAGVLDGAPSDAHRKKIYRVSNTICAIYTNGNYKTGIAEKFIPNKTFNITISAKKLI